MSLFVNFLYVQLLYQHVTLFAHYYFFHITGYNSKGSRTDARISPKTHFNTHGIGSSSGPETLTPRPKARQ